MVDNPLVLVSVVSHRHGDLVARLLGDMNRHCPSGYELRVVLTLNVQEQLPFGEEDFDFPLKVIHNSERRGFGVNHNIAFQSDSCDYFCVLNPDVSLEEDPLPPLLETLGDERVGAVAPFVTNSQGHVEDNARPFPTLLRIFDKALRKILGFKRNMDQGYTIGEEPVSVDWIAGMFILLSSRTFTEIGGFDPDYFLYYEDVDLCARLRSAGYEVLLDSRSKIVHEARRDSHRSIRHLKLHLASMSRFFFKQASLSLRQRG